MRRCTAYHYLNTGLSSPSILLTAKEPLLEALWSKTIKYSWGWQPQIENEVDRSLSNWYNDIVWEMIKNSSKYWFEIFSHYSAQALSLSLFLFFFNVSFLVVWRPSHWGTHSQEGQAKVNLDFVQPLWTSPSSAPHNQPLSSLKFTC